MEYRLILTLSLKALVVIYGAISMRDIIQRMSRYFRKQEKLINIKQEEMTPNVKKIIKKYYVLTQKFKIKNPPTLRLGTNNAISLSKQRYTIILKKADIENGLGYGILLHEFSHIKNNDMKLLHLGLAIQVALLMISIVLYPPLVLVYFIYILAFLKLRRNIELRADKFASEISKVAILEVLTEIRRKRPNLYRCKLMNLISTHPSHKLRKMRIN